MSEKNKIFIALYLKACIRQHYTNKTMRIGVYDGRNGEFNDQRR